MRGDTSCSDDSCSNTSVVVTDGARQVTGLSRDDVAVFEDGQPQEISRFEAFVGGPPEATQIAPETPAEEAPAETGGLLVDSTNDLGAGLVRIARDTETYYVVAYAPTNTRHDGKFRKIEVRLPDHAGFGVRTRAGYFAPDGRETGKDRKEPETAGERAAREQRRSQALAPSSRARALRHHHTRCGGAPDTAGRRYRRGV